MNIRKQRRITLLRHAKSDWNSPARDDFQRPLNARGQRDAPVMGQRLRERGLSPQLIVSSPAVRAITTARIIAAELGYAPEQIQTDERLYHASPATILQVLRSFAAYTDVMIVGHNPGLTELANQLCPIAIDNLPTCGCLSVSFTADSWDPLGRESGELLWFDYPKKSSAN